MSTSPSWFDQEKFSRLVKKVGPKSVVDAVPGQAATETENRPIPNEGKAPTSRISLVSKPPSLLSEQRALPALPRRTAPMPSLRAIFPPAAASRPPAPEPDPPSEETKAEPAVPANDVPKAVDIATPVNREGEELAAVWQKIMQLNEELAYAIKERDHVNHENTLLREQLRQAEEEAKAPGTPPQAQDISLITQERDNVRRDYAALRKEFETLKQEQMPKEESGKARKELEQQLDGFRQKLEERNRELAALKASPGGVGADNGDEKLKQEVVSLREQLARAKDEASVAQRGLALSQRALHETRDTLREATEGTSLSRHNFDNLKNECATLAQQNAVLQAQNDQLTRELAATKSKLTTRL
ncbi:MAG: hypothetical protein LV480_13745 [Methylacidiphilales bacterium]|nr:hypothetical protein [Candidatus Methylacidiphilales bacterium]